MNKKLYKRDGRRFVPVEDLTGQIREVEGTKAICILQTTTERYWAELDNSNKSMTYHEALDYVKTRFNRKGILPTRSLILLLRDKYKKRVNINGWGYWTADVYESDINYVWGLVWAHCGIYNYHRNDKYGSYARAFLIENI